MNLAKLHVGDSGGDVVRLHEALRRLGFAVPTEEAKRKFFGPATREAVTDCQKQHGFEVTGAVDEATAAVLEQEHSVSETGRIGSRALRYGSLDNETTRLLVEKTQGKLSPEGLADSHAFGSQGEEVRQLHKVLHTLGYPIPPTEVQGSIFGEGTQEVVRQFQERNGLKPSGVMDGRTEQILYLRSEIRRPRMVRGRVLQPDGRPLAGAKIQLLEKRLKDEPLVDEGKTESDGSFLFTYSAEERDIDDPGRLALRIAVLDGTIAQPVKSEVLYGPGAEETINMRLPGDQQMPPEWELICASLQPFLEHVDPANLNEEGVAYLAHVSGLDRPQVATYVESAQFARAQNLPEELAFVLGREGQVASKEQLLETTQAQILAAVDSAMAAKSIDEETARRHGAINRGQD